MEERISREGQKEARVSLFLSQHSIAPYFDVGDVSVIIESSADTVLLGHFSEGWHSLHDRDSDEV